MLQRLVNTFNPFANWGEVSAQYRAKDLTPFLEFGWDHVEARRNRYAIYRAYDYNSMYSQLHAFTQVMKETNRLYKFIRGIYNPVGRAKLIMASNVYKGSINRQYLKAGAMPLEYDNEALTVPLQQIIKWSKLDSQLARYVETADVKGDGAWWIVDDPERERVRLESIQPDKVYDAEFDEAGNVKAAIIEYNRQDTTPIAKRDLSSNANVPWYDANLKTYLFRMKLWVADGACRFETYKDNELYPFIKDEDGVARATGSLPYDFVPLVIAPFSPGEGRYGKCAFYNALDKINAVNDGASLVLDQVRKIVVAILKAKGIRKDQLRIDMNSPSGLPIFFIDDPEADVEPLVSNLDLAGAHKIVQDALVEVEKDMPELMFEKGLGNNERPTLPGLSTGFAPAIGRIEDARRNLDPGLAAALQMAITIGGVRGYQGFNGIDLSTYDRGDMDLRLKERPVIADTMTAKERVNAYPTIANLPLTYQRVALIEMGHTEPDAEKIAVDPLAREVVQNSVSGGANAAQTGEGGDRLASAKLRLSQFNGAFDDEGDNGSPARSAS
jgi:hypothetical protein